MPVLAKCISLNAYDGDQVWVGMPASLALMLHQQPRIIWNGHQSIFISRSMWQQ